MKLKHFPVTLIIYFHAKNKNHAGFGREAFLHPPSVSFGTHYSSRARLFSFTRCSRLFLFLPCPSLQQAMCFKELWFPLVVNCIDTPRVGVKCVSHSCCFSYPFRNSKENIHELVCTDTRWCTFTCVCLLNH